MGNSNSNWNQISKTDNKIFIKSPEITTNPITSNKWYMMSFGYNSTHAWAYQNLTNLSSLATTGNMPNSAGSLKFSSCNDTGDGNGFVGVIDEFAFYNCTLTETNIEYIYNNGIQAFQNLWDTSVPNEFIVTTRDSYYNYLINSTVTVSNSSFTNTTNTTNGVVTFYLFDGSYNVSITSNNYDPLFFENWNISYNIAANLTYYKARYKTEEKFKDVFDNSTINSFLMSFYYANNNTLELTSNTTNGNLTVDLSRNNSYYAIIDALGYELKNVTFNTSSDYTQQQEVYFYPQNSVRIFIRDEDTNNLINQQVGIKFTSDIKEYNFETSNGTILVQNLTPDSYSVRFNSSGYSIRTYPIIVSNRSSQELNAYLSVSDKTTIFTIKDKSSLDTIDNVLLTMYRFYNKSYEVVESKFSDITGRIQVTYTDDTKYKFYLAKSGYQDFIFYLDPVLFSEYTIQIERLSTINATLDYDHVSILVTPKIYTSGVNNFTFNIQNPFGELITYGYNLTYPGGTIGNIDNNVLGSELISSFTIVNPAYTDRLKVDYFYESTIVGRRNFTFYYPIQYTGANYTMVNANSDPTYGLGLLERVIMVVLIGILIIGFSTIIGRTIGGIILTFVIWSYLVYIQFISIWLVIVSVVIGILILSLRGES